MNLYTRCALLCGAATALALNVAGCAPSANSASPLAPLAMRSVPTAVQSQSRRSWMLPEARAATLVYAVDSSTGEVNVYDYANGQQVGTISGDFIVSAAGCVDARGDVFLTAAGNVMEYSHGGTTPLRTYTPDRGTIVGCSVDAKGDLAISTSTPGGVVVYAKGNPNHSKTYSNSECEDQAAMGYDDKGDVIGAGNYDGVEVCAVLARARQETTLSTSGMTINSPNRTMWDGKYIAVSDGEAGSEKEVTGIYEATLSGSSLSSQHEVLLTDTCYRGLNFVLNPFILGTKNTPANDRQGSVVVGVNGFCFESGSGGGLEYWHYPKGGNPYKIYPTTDEISVLVVSIAT